MFGGNNNRFYKMDSTGAVTTLPNTPVGNGLASSVQVVDPVSGELIMIRGTTMYAYNSDSNQWRTLSVTAPFNADGNIAGKLGGSGKLSKIMASFCFFTILGRAAMVFGYKHSPGTGSPPAAPGAVRVF